MSEEREDEQRRRVLEQIEREFGERRRQDVDPRLKAAFEGGETVEPRPVPEMGPVEQAPAQQRVRLRLPVSRPRLVYAILAINVLMYGVTLALTFSLQNAAAMSSDDAFTRVLYLLGAKYGPAIDAGQWWRFLTPIVLHGGLIHLAFNTYALYGLGPESERIYGSGRFLAIYLLAGLAGSIASYIRSPGLSIGASGAIFGLIGALAAFFRSARGLIGAEASRQQVTQLISMAAINIVLGFSVAAVDNAAHLGGLFAGGIAGYALAPSFAVDDRVYPPVLVRADRPARAWMWTGLILVALVGVIVAVIGRYS